MKELPGVTELLDARSWLYAGAPSASKYHDAEKAVHTLLQLIECLPEHLPLYCYGTPENFEARRRETKQERRDAFELVQEAFTQLAPFELEAVIARFQDNAGTLEALVADAAKKETSAR